MKNHKLCLFFLSFFLIFTFISKRSWPQLSLGQYEDEAPFRTWNTLGISTAPSLALGESRFALAADSSVSLSNPGLLTNLPRITFTFNTSLNAASFFKYSLINTGVVSTEGNLSSRYYAIDFISASLRVRNWTFALSQALIEVYNRPSAKPQYKQGGNLQYFLEHSQEGSLKNLNFSISRKLFSKLSVGIGFNYIYGHLKKDIKEKWISDDITITDSKSHDFQGFYINGGLILNLLDKVALAAIFRTPYEKKAESQSLLRYYSPRGNTDIKIEASSQSTYKQPIVLGIGANFKLSQKLKIVSDFTFFNWSKYKVKYFEEELKRNFKNILKISAGVEYLKNTRIFNHRIDAPIRAGLSYDPQPIKKPNSSYYYLSFGTGLHWEKFFLDAGAIIGIERGSGNSLFAKRIALSLSFML